MRRVQMKEERGEERQRSGVGRFEGCGSPSLNRASLSNRFQGRATWGRQTERTKRKVEKREQQRGRRRKRAEKIRSPKFRLGFSSFLFSPSRHLRSVAISRASVCTTTTHARLSSLGCSETAMRERVTSSLIGFIVPCFSLSFSLSLTLTRTQVIFNATQ